MVGTLRSWQESRCDSSDGYASQQHHLPNPCTGSGSDGITNLIPGSTSLDRVRRCRCLPGSSPTTVARLHLGELSAGGVFRHHRHCVAHSAAGQSSAWTQFALRSVGLLPTTLGCCRSADEASEALPDPVSPLAVPHRPLPFPNPQSRSRRPFRRRRRPPDRLQRRPTAETIREKKTSLLHMVRSTSMRLVSPSCSELASLR